MRELFINELADCYNSEMQLIRALPKMSEAATDSSLVAAFTDHIEETREQILRLEEIFRLLGEKPRSEKCEATEGLVKEAEEFIHNINKGSLLDAALITAAQKAEHYEIASYGSLHAFAVLLGENQIANILEATLNEEKATDSKLSSLAENFVNKKALVESAEKFAA